MNRAQRLQQLGLALGNLAWRHSASFVFWVLGALFVFFVTREAFSTRLITYSQGTDYWEHTAALRALMDSPTSRADPYTGLEVGSARLMPHYLAIALLARALGLDALGAASIAACVNTVLFVLGIYVFFRLCFRDRRAPLYGLLVMLGAWWQGFHYSNVYQPWVFFSVAAYPSTAALGMSLLTLAAGWTTLKRGSPLGGLVLTAALLANTLLTHLLTAVIPVVGLLFMAMTEPGLPRARLKLAASVLFGVLSTHLWPYYSPLVVAMGGSGRLSGWVGEGAASLVSSAAPARRLHEFYKFDALVQALGLGLPGFVLACWMIALRRWAFVGLGVLATLLPFIANAFVRVPLGHRFILLTLFYLHIALVWGLLMLSDGFDRHGPLSRRPWSRRLLFAGALLVLGLFAERNVTLAHTRLAGARKAESPFVRYSRAVAERAGPNALVLATPLESWPLPSFGTKVIPLFHENPLVPDEAQRTRDATRFFATNVGAEERDQILQRWRPTHVLVGPRASPDLQRYLQARATPVLSIERRTLFALSKGREAS